MIRLKLLAVLVSAIPAVAYADGPCADEAEAAQRDDKRHGLDPSLVSPTEPAAIEKMKEAKVHHLEAVRLASIVAMRDRAPAEFQAAIDGYVAAALRTSAPVLLFNLAQVYRAAGDYPNAIEQYELFLKRAKARPPLRTLIKCQIDAMRAEMERAASTAPPQGPAPVRDAPTTTSATSKPPAPTSPAVPVETAPASGLELGDGAGTPRETRSQTDVVGWSVAGGGLAVAGVGVFLLLDARSLRGQAADETRDDVRIELDEKADGRQTWGTITTVAGVAILAGGIVKLALRPTSSANTHPAVSLSIAPNGFVVGGRF